MFHLRMVSRPCLRKSFWLTNSKFKQVDEDYYSDEDNQEPLGMDKSDLAQQDDG
jgi:hypothetical protein